MAAYLEGWNPMGVFSMQILNLASRRSLFVDRCSTRAADPGGYGSCGSGCQQHSTPVDRGVEIADLPWQELVG